MPIVLTENEATESGITYEDKTGVSYEYPAMYRKLVQPGERFVYYRGRKRRGGGRHPQVYFGSGLIGEVTRPSEEGARLTCRILDYRPFSNPISFKAGDGYLETAGSRRGYFQRGVRGISENEYARILEAADIAAEAESTNQPALPMAEITPPDASGRLTYASPETLRLIETFAVNTAVVEIERRYPGAGVRILPRNNPGFDIEVRTPEATLYVEVKGTARASIQFFVTEGELQFSRRHAQQYRLIVIYGIDLARGLCRVHWYEGAISPDTGFCLQPIQWACELVHPHESAQGTAAHR